MATRSTGQSLPLPLQFMAAWLAVWLGRVLQEQVDFLKAENRLLKEKLGTKRIRLTDAERRRLATLGKKLFDPPPRVIFHATFSRRVRHLMHDTPSPSRARWLLHDHLLLFRAALLPAPRRRHQRRIHLLPWIGRQTCECPGHIFYRNVESSSHRHPRSGRQFPLFTEHFHGLLARCQNAYLGRFENFWSSDPTSVVRLVEANDILGKMTYAFTNSTAADLVDTVEACPKSSALKSAVHIVSKTSGRANGPASLLTACVPAPSASPSSA
jgi:hypothetical protein